MTGQNYPLAFEIFRDLYSRKFSGTAFYMGLYYQNGFAVQQDYQKALQYYQEGAKQGDSYCYTQPGSLYGRGEGADKDPKKALAYYRQAAGLGDSLAYVNFYAGSTAPGPGKYSELRRRSRECHLSASNRPEEAGRLLRT